MRRQPHGETTESALDLLRSVDAVNWPAYARASPKYYRPADVPAAFRLLLGASTMSAGWAAYDRMLFAVGNNHAGCLYPAAVPAAPLLTRIVRDQSGWSRWATLEILIEFLAFDATPAEFTDPAGSLINVKEAVLATVLDLHDDLVRLALSPVVVPAGESSRDLLEVLDDETSGR